MKFSDLFSADGKLSHSKLWSNVGLAAFTAVFLHRGIFITPPLMDYSFEMLVFGATVISPALLGKLLNLRFGGANVDTKTDSTDQK